MANLRRGKFTDIKNALGGATVPVVILAFVALIALVLGAKLLFAWGVVTLFNIAFGTAYSTLQAFVVLVIVSIVGNAFKGSRVNLE